MQCSQNILDKRKCNVLEQPQQQRPRNPWFNYKLYAKTLYLIGLGVGASRIVPLSWSLFRLLVLLFKFFLVVCLLHFFVFTIMNTLYLLSSILQFV